MNDLIKVLIILAFAGLGVIIVYLAAILEELKKHSMQRKEIFHALAQTSKRVAARWEV